MAAYGLDAQAAVKVENLMEQSGRLSGQAHELLSALLHIENHLIGAEPRPVAPSTGGDTPVAPMLQGQLRDTSRVLSNAFDVAHRIKQGMGI